MILKEIGALLLFLLAVLLVGNLWFHLVDGLLERIKGLFTRRRPPPVWHPFPEGDQRPGGEETDGEEGRSD